jgi:hypothetical protein
MEAVMTIDRTKPIYFARGHYHVIDEEGLEHGINETNYPDIFSDLAAHPEALVPEPVQPPPSAEEIKARRIAEIKARFLEIDLETARPGRAVSLGLATLEDNDKLAALENECAGLRVELRELLA